MCDTQLQYFNILGFNIFLFLTLQMDASANRYGFECVNYFLLETYEMNSTTDKCIMYLQNTFFLLQYYITHEYQVSVSNLSTHDGNLVLRLKCHSVIFNHHLMEML